MNVFTQLVGKFYGEGFQTLLKNPQNTRNTQVGLLYEINMQIEKRSDPIVLFAQALFSEVVEYAELSPVQAKRLNWMVMSTVTCMYNLPQKKAKTEDQSVKDAFILYNLCFDRWKSDLEK